MASELRTCAEGAHMHARPLPPILLNRHGARRGIHDKHCRLAGVRTVSSALMKPLLGPGRRDCGRSASLWRLPHANHSRRPENKNSLAGRSFTSSLCRRPRVSRVSLLGCRHPGFSSDAALISGAAWYYTTREGPMALACSASMAPSGTRKTCMTFQCRCPTSARAHVAALNHSVVPRYGHCLGTAAWCVHLHIECLYAPTHQ